jgi:alpha-tubulin suppressor-like RCC1 family protein
MMIKRRQALRQRVNLLFIGTLLCSMGCGARTGLEVSDTSAPTDGGEGGSDSTPCPTTFADCHNSGHCQTDLNESSENCGACGNVCPDGLVCGAGVCRHPADIIQVAAGYAYSCALRASGQVLCWGANDSGVLGDGSFESHDTPVQHRHDAVRSRPTPRRSTTRRCARGRRLGPAVCWGAGDGGMLENGSDDQPAGRSHWLLNGIGESRKEAACTLLRTGRSGAGASTHPDRAAMGRRTWMPEPVVNLDRSPSTSPCSTASRYRPGEVACWSKTSSVGQARVRPCSGRRQSKEHNRR